MIMDEVLCNFLSLGSQLDIQIELNLVISELKCNNCKQTNKKSAKSTFIKDTLKEKKYLISYFSTT